MVTLTVVGVKHIDDYIKACEVKRAKVIEAGLDTADENPIPTIADVRADIEYIGVDEDGDYYNGWNVTESYSADNLLYLKQGVDFFLEED